MKPNYNYLGFSSIMGPKLRKLVEQQLCDDLKVYGIMGNKFKFDWSESCIEGHDTAYLDGEVENFSGINIFNEKDEHIAEGWMEFIHEPTYNFFIAYWEFLRFFDLGKEINIKDKVGIPLHIFNEIPENVRFKYKTEILKQ
ncbi:hypothetical protein [Peribacillus sp. Hz7]|uniref:hypothetical protein n=1 Tax=Peribacillus sp. Hz7 TaxID=3344873 RepID=UPI0035CA2627